MSEQPPPITDEMLALACKSAREHPRISQLSRQGAGVGYVLPDIVREAAFVLWREWTRGMAVIPLPEPSSLTSHYWKAAGRAVSAHVDDNGRAYVKLDGQLWLTGEAREVGRALIAASAAADRAEQLAAEQAKAVTDA